MTLFMNLYPPTIVAFLVYTIGALLALLLSPLLSGTRYIPNRCVGIVEKLWSPFGPIGEGRFIVVDREAGFQAAVLRGGIYFFYWVWRCRVNKPGHTAAALGGLAWEKSANTLPPPRIDTVWAKRDNERIGARGP
jgi:hypothetical protein